MRLQRRKKKTPQHNTKKKKKKKKKVKKTVSPPHWVYSLITLSQLFLTTRACCCCCCCWAQCIVPCEQELYPPRSMPHSRTWISLCVSWLSLPSSNGGVGWCTGENQLQLQSYPIQLTSIICEEAPPQELQSDLRVKDDVVRPPSDRTACLPATDNHRQCSMKEGRKGGKEGRKDGWMDELMDGWELGSVLYNQGG